HNITSFISILPPPPRSRLSPYTTLFRSRQKISKLQQELENATNSFGETDRRTKQWQTQLNNAQAALNDMERELAQNERAIDELGDELEQSGNQADDFGNELEGAADDADNASSKFDKVGSVVKGM